MEGWKQIKQTKTAEELAAMVHEDLKSGRLPQAWNDGHRLRRALEINFAVWRRGRPRSQQG
jgi:hypothetical protein